MAENPLVELEITSFGVDDERRELYYGYLLKHDGVVVRNDAISKTGEQFPEALTNIKTTICSIAQTQADASQSIDFDPYAVIKGALRQVVITELNLDIE